MPDGSIRSDFAVKVSHDGTIEEVVALKKLINKSEPIHRECGLLMPGLINCHSHLELSWCRGLFPENAGMENFYGAMSGVHGKRPSGSMVNVCIENAILEMAADGIVAVADISNTDITLMPKLKRDLYFHTFLEVFGTNPIDAASRFSDILKIQNVFSEENLANSLSAHTLITLSEKLMSLLITRIAAEKKSHSIHFLESLEEKKYFEEKIPVRNIHGYQSPAPEFNSAAEAACRLLLPDNRIMFVHNTFADENDIRTLTGNFRDPWFCFCPASNLYITGKLPDVPMISSISQNILLGTDSLSSNNELNLFSEIDILLAHFPEIYPEVLLKAATINGARFLGIDNQYGSIEAHKKPGLVLLENYRPGIRKFSSLKIKRLI